MDFYLYFCCIYITTTPLQPLNIKFLLFPIKVSLCQKLIVCLCHNSYLPILSCLSCNPFVVFLPFSLFCLCLCSCHSPFCLPFSYTYSFFWAGLTVLPLLNERFTTGSLTLFVFPPLQYAPLNIVCFTSSKTASSSLCLYRSISACLFLLGAQPSKWTATDEAPCLSAVLEGINHNSVSALMRFQRCLFEIEPSGASDQSFTDSSLRQETEPGIKACLGPSPAFRCEWSWAKKDLKWATTNKPKVV